MLSKLKGQVNKARCFNHFFTTETKLRCGLLSVFNGRLPMNISFKMNFLKRFICTCLNCGSLHFASCKQQLGPFTLCLYVNLLMLRKVVRREGGGTSTIYKDVIRRKWNDANVHYLHLFG